MRAAASKRTPLLLLMIFLLLAGAGCEPGARRDDGGSGVVARPIEADLAARAAMAGGYAASDRFIWAVGEHPAPDDASPAEAARHHLERFMPAHGAHGRDLALMELRALHDLGPTGFVAWFAQRAEGVEVYPSEVRLLLRPDRSLVAVSGRPPRVGAKIPPFEPSLSMAKAMALTVTDVTRLPLQAQDVVPTRREQGDFRYFTLAEGLPVYVPEGRVKPLYFVRGDEVEPAYFVELYVGFAGDVEAEARRVIVSARTGEILDRRSLTFSQAFDYRVWASATGDLRPQDGPIADFTPHPAGRPDGLAPDLNPTPSLVRVEGFNTNPQGGADPWLPAGASQTLGNNVSAYTDDNAPDGFSSNDLRASTTSSGAFDRVYDLSRGPVADDEQRMASVTSLFYVTNWLHDYWYDSGFDEAAGNAQQNNYGRGGAGGDRMRAEAQDGHASGRRNNANMSTPGDGMSPRMQMYTWSGVSARTVTANGQSYQAGQASFGPTSFNVTASLVLADDGAAPTADACQPLAGSLQGAIVLADRGNCTFVTKTLNVQAAGGAGLIIANNRGGGPPSMDGSASTPINVAVLSVTQADGASLKTALAAGAVSATLVRSASVDRDGSLDYMVVAHEWGHYLHNRLADCGSVQCRGTGEGWGDFLSLHTSLRAGDDLDGAYAVGLWATRGRTQAGYFGIRRAPYSVDPDKNALRFRHIQDGEPLPTTHPIDPSGANSQVHNTGEVWASMLLDGYVALLRPTESSTGAAFAAVRRRFADYIVAGLMMAPPDATFTEQRDAILAAASVRSATDLDVLARAFAGRGAGSCAQSPPRRSTTNSGVVESDRAQPILSVGAVRIDDGIWSCDQDGVLDAEEEGTVTFEVANAGPVNAPSTRVSVTSTHAGFTFREGTSVTLPALGPYQTETVRFSVDVAPGIRAPAVFTVAVGATNPAACIPTVTSTVVARLNVDEVGGQTRDDVESMTTPWTGEGADAGLIWSREAVAPLQTAWVGVDFGRPSDTWLVSPTLQVDTTPFVISLEHRYRFEANAPDGTATNWDGGVIEISGDDGQTWEDIATYVDPGYRGVLTDRSGNPLADRRALVGTSTAWPARQRLTLPLGTRFARQRVKLRFRIGTDASVGDYGWEIDNIDILGISNAPFTTVGPDRTQCPPRIVAAAGLDQVVEPGHTVTLDGTASASAEGLPLTYGWSQVAGPPVALAGASSPQPSWLAPVLTASASYAFQLVVSDGVRSAADRVAVVVEAAAPLVADAGPDQSVAAAAGVVLDGSASAYDRRLPIAYSWRQLDGPAVSLAGAATATATFEAPALDDASRLTFALTVTDGVRTSTDAVAVEVGAIPWAPLIVDAGPDRAVTDGQTVLLEGSATGDRRLAITLSWAQTDGPAVDFTRNEQGVAQFVAEGTDADVGLRFELTASDGERTATDDVEIAVAAVATPPAAVREDGGCGCTAAARAGGPAAPWLLSTLALLAVRRRGGRRS